MSISRMGRGGRGAVHTVGYKRAAIPYRGKVIATGPIAYWIQGEAAGLVAVDQINSPAQDGTYTGVTLGQPGIGDGNTAPLYDGANDYTNVQSAALTAAFDADAGSILAWARVFNAAVWADATTDVIIRLEADADNYVSMVKTAGVNQLRFLYEAAGVAETSNAAYSSTDWFSMAVTWERPGNFIQYLNGAPVATDAIGGVWAGALALSLLGAQTAVPASTWNGWLAHYAVWDRVLTPAEIADLAVATP